MPELPTVQVGKHPITSWANKVNHAVSANDVNSTSDVRVVKTHKGITLKLNPKFNALFDRASYKGEYNFRKGYDVNSIVRVLPDGSYTDSNGDEVGATPGVWICVATVPSLDFTEAADAAGIKRADYPTYIRADVPDYFPQWPEPANLATVENPDGRYWELISLLPTTMVSCENGVEKTHYVDAVLTE